MKRLSGKGENKGLGNMVRPAFSVQGEQKDWGGNESKTIIRKCLYMQTSNPQKLLPYTLLRQSGKDYVYTDLNSI